MSSLAARVSTVTRVAAGDRVAKGAVGSAALNISATALNFAITLVLTNALGPRGYGAFAFAFAWSTLLAVPATLGQPQLIVRSVACYLVERDWARMRGMVRHSHLVALGSSVVIVAVAGGVGALALANRTQFLHPFLIALLAVPLIAVTSMRQSAMMGLGRVLLGRIPETVLAPAGFLALALGGVIVFGHRFSASAAMAAQVASGVVAWIVGLALLRRSLPTQMHRIKPVYEHRAWGVSTGWLMALSLAGTALSGQLAVVMLGALGTASEAGVYQAANRAALFVSFLFMAATYSVGPAVARLWAQRLDDEIQTLVTRAVRVLFALSIPVALGFLAFAPQLLQIFGGGFRGGATVLRILAVGELFRVGAGFGQVALVTAGYERDLVWVALVALGLTFVLGLVLIPVLDGSGAALASAIGLAAAAVTTAILARRRLSLSVAVFGGSRRSDNDQRTFTLTGS